MSLSTGMPELLCESLSRISPASPTVCPSWIATRVRISRWSKVGELRVLVTCEGTFEETLLTSCEISRVTRPPELTLGVTSRMTPVSR